MKESIGGISLFNIVIVFVMVFTGYISLTINYSKAYNIKNEILNIIRNQGGVCTSSVASSGNKCYTFKDQIVDYFKETNYTSVGRCDDDWYGYSRSGELLGLGSKKAAFCVKAIEAHATSELPDAVYYKVKMFYHLDLPVINRFWNFTVEGETTRVYAPNECDFGGLYYWCD